jgi:hypothetical protein
MRVIDFGDGVELHEERKHLLQLRLLLLHGVEFIHPFL